MTRFAVLGTSALVLPCALAGCTAGGRLFFSRCTAGCNRLLCPAARQKLLCLTVIAGQLVFPEGRARIGILQTFDGFVEQDRRLRRVGLVGGVGCFVAGRAHGVAGAAGCTRAAGVSQQIQRLFRILFRVQQHTHTDGGVQLLPAALAGKIRHPVIVVRAFLLALGNMVKQCAQTVGAGLVLPVPAQQAAADLIAGGLDLKSGL